MLQLVALERRAWAVFKIISCALASLLLFLWFAWARRRRRALRAHEQGLSVQGVNGASVKLIQVRVEEPDKVKDPRSAPPFCNASLVEEEADDPVKAFHVHNAANATLNEAQAAVKISGVLLEAEAEQVFHAANANLVQQCPDDPVQIYHVHHRAHQECDADVVRDSSDVDCGGSAASDSFIDLEPEGSSVKDEEPEVEPLAANAEYEANDLGELLPLNLPLSSRDDDDLPMAEVWTQEDMSIPLAGSFSWKGRRRSSILRDVQPSGSKGHTVRFTPRVHCRSVPNLLELSTKRKAAYWWQKEDFDQFLKVRIEIAKAYRKAARVLGVDIMKLSSVGNMSQQGYKAMVQQMPELAHESRRGLGLGRKSQRAKSRDQYIAAVLKEQRRQRDVAIEKGEIDPKDGDQPFALDTTQLAAVAGRVSEKDRKYSHQLAQKYIQKAAAEEKRDAEEAAKAGPDARAQDSDNCLRLFVIEHDSDEDPDSISPAKSFQSTPSNGSDDEDMARTFSEDLNDDLDRPFPPSPKVSTQIISKGFGLSRDHLAQKGLSASGHYISTSQKNRARYQTSPANMLSDESDGDLSATDCDETDLETDLEDGHADVEDDGDGTPHHHRERKALTHNLSYGSLSAESSTLSEDSSEMRKQITV